MQPANALYITITVCFAIINIALAICGTIANMLIIKTFCKHRRVRVVQNTLFALLATTDLLITAFAQPIYIVAMLQSAFFVYTCELWLANFIVTYLCLGLSLITVTVLTWHSFITLAFPYHYQRLVAYLKSSVAISWLSMIVIVALLTCFASLKGLATTGAIFILFTMSTVTLTWLWIYKLIRRHRHRIITNQTPTNHTGNLLAQRKMLRSTATACMIVGGLITCYMLGLSRLIYDAYIIDNSWIVLEYVIGPLSTTLMYGNSLINPCLVLWRNAEFREAAKRILC